MADNPKGIRIQVYESDPLQWVYNLHSEHLGKMAGTAGIKIPRNVMRTWMKPLRKLNFL